MCNKFKFHVPSWQIMGCALCLMFVVALVWVCSSPETWATLIDVSCVVHICMALSFFICVVCVLMCTHCVTCVCMQLASCRVGAVLRG